MTSLPRFLRPSAASLLLLGLTSLLLWGQCAFTVVEGGGSRRPPAANLHLQTAVRVVRLDSASTRGPQRLYLTVALQNLSDKPCRLASLDCALWLDKNRAGYAQFAKNDRGRELPARGEQTFAVAIIPYVTKAGPPDIFKQLHAAWQQGMPAQHRSRLEVFYAYYPADGQVEEANRRTKMLPLGK